MTPFTSHCNTTVLFSLPVFELLNFLVSQMRSMSQRQLPHLQICFHNSGPRRFCWTRLMKSWPALNVGVTDFQRWILTVCLAEFELVGWLASTARCQLAAWRSEPAVSSHHGEMLVSRRRLWLAAAAWREDCPLCFKSAPRFCSAVHCCHSSETGYFFWTGKHNFACVLSLKGNNSPLWKLWREEKIGGTDGKLTWR